MWNYDKIARLLATNNVLHESVDGIIFQKVLISTEAFNMRDSINQTVLVHTDSTRVVLGWTSATALSRVGGVGGTAGTAGTASPSYRTPDSIVTATEPLRRYPAPC
jgi:hypothetical protein